MDVCLVLQWQFYQMPCYSVDHQIFEIKANQTNKQTNYQPVYLCIKLITIQCSKKLYRNIRIMLLKFQAGFLHHSVIKVKTQSPVFGFCCAVIRSKKLLKIS